MLGTQNSEIAHDIHSRMPFLQVQNEKTCLPLGINLSLIISLVALEHINYNPHYNQIHLKAN